MGARLRKLKTMNRDKKLSDGKSISGKNRLTDKFIDTITTYYGNAIRQNNSSVIDMRQVIRAIYCHRCTDEETMHHFCPIGDTSRCKYQKAVATNSASLFKHKSIVPIAIMDEIKPIIAELSAPKFLKKCVEVKTKTANESFNSTVWKYCPKTFVCGSSKNIVDIALNEAIVMFNEGMKGRIKIMKALGFKIGRFTVTSAFKANYAGIKNAEIKSKAYTLEARRASKMRTKATNVHFAELEGSTYEAGSF
ncbi:uncharacterized protein TNCV_1562521 [Trichonephila clavipes]|nr:uncharacterized protein TNCV_1562521 [Trichonephila clavipes]